MHSAIAALTIIVAVGAVVPGVAGRRAQYPSQVAGLVTDDQGRPLAGVVVNALLGDLTVTGQDGRFRLTEAWPVVRFTADGFVPSTRLTTTIAAEATIVLRAAAIPPRVVPACTGAPAAQTRPGRLVIPTPKGVRRSRADDIDYETESWRFKGVWLQHGWGTSWSGGLPLPQTLENLTRVEERDVRLPLAPTPGAPSVHLLSDVRGIHPDGRRYRFVGQMLETFEYRHASPEAAAFFDRMLDAMCYVPDAAAALVP